MHLRCINLDNITPNTFSLSPTAILFPSLPLTFHERKEDSSPRASKETENLRLGESEIPFPDAGWRERDAEIMFELSFNLVSLPPSPTVCRALY